MCPAACVALILLLASPCPCEAAAPSRTLGWRGDGTGRYPKADPPTEWDIDEGTNILWQAIVGKGHSTPLVAGSKILVTAEQDFLVCVDRRNGKILWKKDNGFSALPPARRRPKQRPPTAPGCGYGTPTPVTGGKLIYANYGTGVVVCYDLDGSRQWIRYLDLPQVTQYGRSASPRLVKGKLLISISGLLALDPQTGKTLWRAKGAKPSYGTPAIARIGDAAVAITPNGDCVRVSDGKILARNLGSTKFSSPLALNGVVYFADTPAVAVKLPARADERIQPIKLWQADDLEGEFYASPVWHDGIVYCASNQGILYALDARTGKIAYQKELEIPCMSGMPGMEPANIYGSLVIAGKYLFLTNDIGNTLVLAPGREYKEVAHNCLDKGSGASPVADGKHLFLRGGKKLYCIGSK